MLALLLLVPEAFGRRLLRYEPVVVECWGKVRLVYLAGPPNYESIKHGDLQQGVYVLELEEPFDIASANDSKIPLNDSDGWGTNVKRVQLISDRKLKKLVGKNVTISGTLSEAIFGNHHTEVVMQVMRVNGK